MICDPRNAALLSQYQMVTIRRAIPKDAPLLAEHRAAVWHEVGEWSVADLIPQVPLWAAFFGEHLDDAAFVAFIAEEEGRSIGSGGLLIHLATPRPHSESDRAGRVQSVYVVPAARRRGIARAIVTRMLEYAREAKLISLALHPSDEARALYTTLGFKAADEMLLRFT